MTNSPKGFGDPDELDDPDSLGDRFDDFKDRVEKAAVQAEYATGDREESYEEARSGAMVRMARMSFGFLVLIVGIAALPLPGPGWLIIAGGLTILAKDVAWAERLLRYIRKKIPGIPEDGKIPPSQIATIAVMTLAAIAMSLWWTLGRGSDTIQAGIYEVTSSIDSVNSLTSDSLDATITISDEGPLVITSGCGQVEIAVTERSKSAFSLGDPSGSNCSQDAPIHAVIEALANQEAKLTYETDGLKNWFFADNYLATVTTAKITLSVSK